MTRHAFSLQPIHENIVFLQFSLLRNESRILHRFSFVSYFCFLPCTYFKSTVEATLKKICMKFFQNKTVFLQSGLQFVILIRQKVDVMCQSHNPGPGHLPTVQSWESEDVITVDQTSHRWEPDLRGEKNGQGYKTDWTWTCDPFSTLTLTEWPQLLKKEVTTTTFNECFTPKSESLLAFCNNYAQGLLLRYVHHPVLLSNPG